MKQLSIPRIQITANDLEAVAQQLSNLPHHRIDMVNWGNQYPSKPTVSFTIAHDDEQLYLQYHVHEQEILAVVAEDNGPVWTDSCVEMFISFDGEHYYNAEFTCVGKALLGYRVYGQHVEHAPQEVLQTIQRLPSLGTRNRQRQQGDFQWTLTLVIPRTVFWKSAIDGFNGLQAKGNFFKCGDHLSTPHFVAWTAIDTPEPSFHQPQFFGELTFE